MKRLIIAATCLTGLFLSTGSALAAPTICVSEAWRPSEDHGDGNVPKYAFVSNRFDAMWRASTDSLEMANRFGDAVGGQYGHDANGSPDLNINYSRCYQGDLGAAEAAFVNAVEHDIGAGPTQIIQVNWPQ